MQRGALLLATLPLVAAAENPLECVDPDIANGFFDSWNDSRSEFSRSLPADFENIEMPNGFDIVGSRIRESRKSAVFKTAKAPGPAVADVMEILTSTGWSNASYDGRAVPGGFKVPSTPTSATVCRDTAPGVLLISAWNRSGQSYISLTHRTDTRYRNCNNYRTYYEHGFSAKLRKHVPLLEYPDGVNESAGNGASSGISAIHLESRVNTTIDRKSLVTHFGDQVRDQNWELDAEWSGRTSSGSLWIKETADVGMLVGTLYVFDTTNGDYKLQFDLYSDTP